MDSPAGQDKAPNRGLLIAWAFAATFVAIASTGFAIYFWMQARQASMPRADTANAFLDLPESAVAGRYKWITKSGENVMTLNEDHSFSYKDGAINPAHRWEITRDAIVVFWLRSQNRFSKTERPGVYVEVRDGVELTRLEKQE